MNPNQFSFKNLLEISSISQSNSSLSKNKSTNSTSESQNYYKQKYLETKNNVKKFIEMVEKQFEKLTKSHNEQKQKLVKQIVRLKQELQAKKDIDVNDVSDFTVRSKISASKNRQKSFHHNKRSLSNQTKNNFSLIGFDGIQEFQQQSKIMNQSTKSFAVSAKSQTLIELQNALNQEKKTSKSRITQKNQPNPLENLTENDLSISSLNVNEYKTHILGYRKNKLKQRQQNQVNLADQKQNSPIKKQFNKQVTITRDDFSNRKGKQNQDLTQKKNEESAKRQSSQKVQQKSVHNILKNLRNTMKVNIEKQSKLQPPVLTR